MYEGHCAYCGKAISIKNMQIDHVRPLLRRCYDKYSVEHRGDDDESNMMPSCRSCNFRKGVMSVEQFREELKRQCDNIIKRSFQVRQSMDYGLLVRIDKPIVFYFETIEKNKQRYG